MRNFYTGLFVGLWIIVLLLVYLHFSGRSMAYCPEEDSCYPDYRNGAWYIEQGVK